MPKRRRDRKLGALSLGKSRRAEAPRGTSIPLHSAARAGDAARVSQLLTELKRDGCGIAVDARDEHGRTACHLAAWAGNGQVIQVLLDFGDVDVNLQAQNAMTALHFASQSGCCDGVQALLASGAVVDAPLARDRKTPLHLAAAKGHVAIVEALVAAGADINARTRHGETPFDLAASDAIRQSLVATVRSSVIQLKENSEPPAAAPHLADDGAQRNADEGDGIQTIDEDESDPDDNDAFL